MLNMINQGNEMYNPVAKNAHKFNKSSVHADRKKALKRGSTKHKAKILE